MSGHREVAWAAKGASKPSARCSPSFEIALPTTSDAVLSAVMSEDAKLEHRLAAIMATDVVGYSQSMQSDEAGTLAALNAIREATENQVSQHRGRIANTAGDSVLAEFGSALDAVSCAVALQQQLAENMHQHELRLRIGVHIGDVVIKKGDLFGTAVNVASRLESIAEAGG